MLSYSYTVYTYAVLLFGIQCVWLYNTVHFFAVKIDLKAQHEGHSLTLMMSRV